MTKNFSQMTLVAIQAALKSGELLKNGLNQKFKIKKKEGSHNLVTEYDYLSEEIIISTILAQFPNHTIISEEKGKISNRGDYTWIIDPLDGTVNFAHGLPFFAISIALAYQEEVIMGVVFFPMQNELFIGERKKGAYLNGKRLSVNKTRYLKECFLATGFPYIVKQNLDRSLEKNLAVLKEGIPIRRIGAAALDLAYVAAGRFDGFWQTNLKSWDCAASSLLIEEAGGVLSDYEGKKIKLNNPINLVAANKTIHPILLKLLRSA